MEVHYRVPSLFSKRPNQALRPGPPPEALVELIQKVSTERNGEGLRGSMLVAQSPHGSPTELAERRATRRIVRRSVRIGPRRTSAAALAHVRRARPPRAHGAATAGPVPAITFRPQRAGVQMPSDVDAFRSLRTAAPTAPLYSLPQRD